MTVVLDGESLTPAAVVRIARENTPVSITDDASDRVRRSRERVEDVLDRGEAVYGINTGFGELVDVRIPPSQLETLQVNLLRSHVAGTGRRLSPAETRAMMVARINALLAGYSGVREVIVDRLVELLNERVHPVVHVQGSLGASGDLAPLAEMALVLIGEGSAIVDDEMGGTVELPGADALGRVGIEPVTLKPKEGLALINGTQLTTALGVLAAVDAHRLVRTADLMGAMTTEMTLGTTATADPAIHHTRPFPGQQASAATIRLVTAGSDIVEAHRNCDRVQDPYSLRCMPQVHGAARDALDHLRQALRIELNSATDNPLVFPAETVDDRASGTDRGAVISGGNFHGTPLAVRLEYLRIALVELGNIAERRIDLLLNPNRQEPHLPPFLAANSGLESGYMIAQYAAAAVLNDLRSTGVAAVDNTPVSGGQEDHVSNSAQVAVNIRRTADQLEWILATEYVCAAAAREYIEQAFETDNCLQPGIGTALAYDRIRMVVDPLDGDRPVREDVAAAKRVIGDPGLLEAVDQAVDGELP